MPRKKKGNRRPPEWGRPPGELPIAVLGSRAERLMRVPATPRIERARKRITFDVAPEIQHAIAQQGLKERKASTELVREAVTQYLEGLGYKITRVHEDVSGERVSGGPGARNVKQLVFQSHLLIHAFEEVLSYEPLKHHNKAPPELWINDENYLGELRQLVQELKRLNSNLETLGKSTAESAPKGLRAHLHTFLDKYAGTLGTGAGVMTLGAVATLMYHLGAGEVIFDHLLKKLPGAD